MEQLLHRHLPPLVSPLPAVRLFEPTKSSAMHEIVRASFPPVFSLCGGRSGVGGQATCSPCKSPSPALTLLCGVLVLSLRRSRQMNNLLQTQNLRTGSAGSLSLTRLTQPQVRWSEKPLGGVVTFNPCQPSPHII